MSWLGVVNFTMQPGEILFKKHEPCVNIHKEKEKDSKFNKKQIQNSGLH